MCVEKVREILGSSASNLDAAIQEEGDARHRAILLTLRDQNRAFLEIATTVTENCDKTLVLKQDFRLHDKRQGLRYAWLCGMWAATIFFSAYILWTGVRGIETVDNIALRVTHIENRMAAYHGVEK